MKKITLTFALGIALFTSMTLLNCSKKEDPAPAATTSGTTTAGTTTSGTTTSGTTTSGTTTAGTTSGSTTALMTFKGSGTFTVDGVDYSGEVSFIPDNVSGYGVTCKGNGLSIVINITSKIFKDATYTVVNVQPQTLDKAGIAVVSDNSTAFGTGKQYWSNAAAGGTVTVVGKTVSFNNVKLTLTMDDKVVVNVSAKLTIE